MTLSTEDKLKLIASIEERSEIRATLALQWIQSLCSTIEDIEVAGERMHPSLETVFWIRLHGLLTEILPRYIYMRDELSISMCASAANICESLRDSLSRDMLIYAQYRRDGLAHVYETGYDISVKNGSKLKTRRRVETLGETLTHDAIKLAAQRTIRLHQGERNATASLARSLQSKVRVLVSIFEELNRPLTGEEL